MRIGQLAERTGASRRLLRYYEEQGLISSGRRPNGYRDFAEACVDRVLQIRGLLEAGLPTRVITQLLPCLEAGVVHVRDATPETIATLEAELDRMTARISCLTRNRDAVAGYLDAVRRARGSAPEPSATP
ncbi:MAG TPA: MerR family transcriptional regulator [Pseudonocardia sp.]|nr:MerR family transcriptional regulator [Pseudonocardia sp.]